MSDHQESAEYRAIAKIAVEITVNWFKDNGSYVGIGKLWRLVSDEIIRLKNKGLWPWDIPDEITIRRRINYCQSKAFHAPNPPPLVCLGEKRFLGDTDSCYCPALHSVPEEYRQHLSEFLPVGIQQTL